MKKFKYNYANLKDDEYQNGFYKLGGKGWYDLVHDAELGSSFAIYLMGKEFDRYGEEYDDNGEKFLIRAVRNGFIKATITLGLVMMRRHEYDGLERLKEAREAGFDVDHLIVIGEKKKEIYDCELRLKAAREELASIERGESLIMTEEEDAAWTDEHNDWARTTQKIDNKMYDEEEKKNRKIRKKEIKGMHPDDLKREQELTNGNHHHYDFY